MNMKIIMILNTTKRKKNTERNQIALEGEEEKGDTKRDEYIYSEKDSNQT